jgi:predicted DNA binding CopG/RHH family protein
MQNKKDGSITIRLTIHEVNRIQKAADREYMSMSSFTRKVLLQYLDKNYPDLKKK